MCVCVCGGGVCVCVCVCEQGELYRSLMRVALKQQNEIKSIIQETIISEEESVLQCATSFQFSGDWSIQNAFQLI